MRAVRGLPGRLPADERVVWQGGPCWRSLARHLCHVREVAVYMGVLTAAAAGAAVLDGGGVAGVARMAGPLLAGGAAVLGFLFGLAWWVARTTEYTVTTHRVVIRFGVALPATLAIPHRGIARALVALHGDGTGDMPIATKPGFEVAWRRCWPHARPWRVLRAEPMLRSVPEAGRVAALLAATLAAAGGGAAVAVASLPRHRSVTELTPAG